MIKIFPETNLSFKKKEVWSKTEKKLISDLAEVVTTDTLEILLLKNALDPDVLKCLDNSDLEELGITDLVERKKLLKFAAQYNKEENKTTSTVAAEISEKSRLVTFFFWLFFGIFGAHRFYCNKIKTACVILFMNLFGWMLFLLNQEFPLFSYLLFIAVGIWLFGDFLLILTGNMTKGTRIVRQVTISQNQNQQLDSDNTSWLKHISNEK